VKRDEQSDGQRQAAHKSSEDNFQVS
jgi:hypothetical protein